MTEFQENTSGQQERLAAIGQRVLNVAHEINNPLTAILITSSLVLAEMPDEDPLRTDLETIEEKTGQLRAMVKNLVDFARPVQYYLEEIDIDVAASDAVRVFRRQMQSQGVELCQECCGGPLTVLADRLWLGQVFSNLFSNALDAMPGGGCLTIRTRRGGNVAVAQVIDTGSGIAGTNMARLFEPFFTTKKGGNGIGLGLAISRNVINDLGGRMECASVPGQGSTFTVGLPLLDGGETGKTGHAPKRRGATQETC